MISDIELMMNDSTSLFESITNNLRIWREKLGTQKRFRDEWNEFLTRTRKLMQRTVDIEENFFPKHISNLETSTETLDTNQQRLEQLMQEVKVNTHVILFF